MKIYNYHPETGEFTGATSADESPLEPGAWIVPAHATDIAPVATSENEVAVFDGAEWQVQPDFRKKRVWLAADYDDEEGTEITDIGPLGNRSLTRPAVPPEIQADRDAKATAAAMREQRKTEAFTALQTSLAKRLQITITSPADLAGKADEVESKVAAKRAKAGAPTAREALFEEQLDMIFQLVVLMYRNA